MHVVPRMPHYVNLVDHQETLKKKQIDFNIFEFHLWIIFWKVLRKYLPSNHLFQESGEQTSCDTVEFDVNKSNVFKYLGRL